MKFVCKCGHIFDCDGKDEVVLDLKYGFIRWRCDKCKLSTDIRFLPEEKEVKGESKTEIKMAKYKVVTMIDSIIEASDPAIAVDYARRVILQKLENLSGFFVGKSTVERIEKQEAGER